MKVYQLRLVLGKVANYDQNGKLKNQTITSKYGEMELENILTDQNWKKLGACEISCVKVYDHPSLIDDPAAMKAVNDRINLDIQSGTKPKTEIELLRDQVDELSKQLYYNTPRKTELVPEPSVLIKGTYVKIPTGRKETDEVGVIPAKELRESLFTEARELGLNPAKNVKTDILKDLITNAKQKIN